MDLIVVESVLPEVIWRPLLYSPNISGREFNRPPVRDLGGTVKFGECYGYSRIYRDGYNSRVLGPKSVGCAKHDYLVTRAYPSITPNIPYVCCSGRSVGLENRSPDVMLPLSDGYRNIVNPDQSSTT